MVRRGHLLLLLALLAAAFAALAAPGPAAARLQPRGAPVRVLVIDHISDRMFATLARRGAVGLLRPGFGPTTNRRRALAELVRGAERNERLGGVPPGRVLIGVNRATGVPHCFGVTCIVLELPPKGAPIPNDRLYRIGVLGGGFSGLLTSPTTQIPGLVSIVDIAPTALGHVRGTLSWAPSSDPLGRLSTLDKQIHANNRLKFAALFILAGLLLVLALLGLRATVTAVPAALLVNLGLGIGHVASEVVLIAAIAAGTALLALWLARTCRGDHSLLVLYGGVVALYALVMATRPEWQAINPFGPTQNSRFWGIGNQVETLLLAPLLAGAVLARRRFGLVGFALFGVFGIFVITDNHLGSDGGGAIVLGVALAVLGARLFRFGIGGFLTLLGTSAVVVLWVVSRGLSQPGPDHLRSAFADGGAGLIASIENRVPLAYLPALHQWELVVPLLLVFTVSLTLAWRAARRRVTRDLLLALGVAVGTSLLVNDSAAYELAAGIAVVGAAARFAPAPVPARAPASVWARLFGPSRLEPEPVASESPPS